MNRKLIVEVDSGAFTCDKCTHLTRVMTGMLNWCGIYDSAVFERDDNQCVRLAVCINAERKAKEGGK